MPVTQKIMGASELVEPSTTLSIDLVAYAAGDQLGEKTELQNVVVTNGRGGVIRTVSIFDLLHTTPWAGDLLFFRSDPAGTFTDNSPPDPNDADMGKYCGKVTFAAADWVVLADQAVMTKECAVQFTCEAKSLWIVLIIRTAKTFASAGDIGIRLSIERTL